MNKELKVVVLPISFLSIFIDSVSPVCQRQRWCPTEILKPADACSNWWTAWWCGAIYYYMWVNSITFSHKCMLRWHGMHENTIIMQFFLHLLLYTVIVWCEVLLLVWLIKVMPQNASPHSQTITSNTSKSKGPKRHHVQKGKTKQPSTSRIISMRKCYAY